MCAAPSRRRTMQLGCSHCVRSCAWLSHATRLATADAACHSAHCQRYATLCLRAHWPASPLRIAAEYVSRLPCCCCPSAPHLRRERPVLAVGAEAPVCGVPSQQQAHSTAATAAMSTCVITSDVCVWVPAAKWIREPCALSAGTTQQKLEHRAQQRIKAAQRCHSSPSGA